MIYINIHRKLMQLIKSYQVIPFIGTLTMIPMHWITSYLPVIYPYKLSSNIIMCSYIIIS